MDAAERQGTVPRLGAYEVVRKLARGGMADLFLARTVTDTFERLVVIKKILPRYADNPRFVHLFLDEAKLAKSLKHKNIVEVFDVGGSGGESFFAMEYLHGQDVREVLHRAWKRDEKMPIEHAIQIATHVASALHYAHEKRRPDGTLLDIVHRDVSPSNVIVSYDGAIKLVDFGVAKAASSTVKTRTGTLKGKIAYMSPEQAKGGQVDRRSDVFALGIVLWEMITTSRLFRGENDLATLQLIINEAPKKPSEVNPECPKELERIVLRALAQDPKQRYQTALELQQELEEFVRVQQLVQSSNALGMYMNVLFQPEIASWKEAKAAGTALSEHLTKVGGDDHTAHVSESEFIEPDLDDDYDYEDDIEDDLEQAAISGSIETKEAWPRRAATDTSNVPVAIRHTGSAPIVRPVLGPVIAPVLPARGDQTRPPPSPTTPPKGTPRPELITPSGSMPVVRAQTPVGVPIMPPPAAMPVATPTDGIAPSSWPPMAMLPVSVPNYAELPFSAEQAQRLRQQFLRIGGGILGLLFLIAIIKACAGGGDAPATKQPVTEPVKMAEPPPTEPTAPPTQPAVVDPPAIPDAGVEVIPDAAESAVAVPEDVGSGSGSATHKKKKDSRKKKPPPPVRSPFLPPK